MDVEAIAFGECVFLLLSSKVNGPQWYDKDYVKVVRSDCEPLGLQFQLCHGLIHFPETFP